LAVFEGLDGINGRVGDNFDVELFEVVERAGLDFSVREVGYDAVVFADLMTVSGRGLIHEMASIDLPR
jgi:hypothetical protein